MSFNLQEQYHANVLTIEGKFLGSLEREAMEATVAGMLDSGKTQLVIDLSKTDFMDSSGIGLLIDVANRMRDAQGDARLAGVQDRIKNLFVMTRLLGPVFDDYATVDDALQSFDAQNRNEA